MYFEFFIAINYLKPKGAAGIIAMISLIGIILGVSTLTVTTAVMHGFRLELIRNITDMNGHINIHGESSQALIDTLKEDRSIEKVIPTIDNQAMLNSRSASAGVFIRGISVDDLKKVKHRIISGEVAGFQEGLVIGSRLAENLMVVVGDEVDVISPQSIHTMVGDVPRIKTYIVAGVFEFGMFQYDSLWVYMPLDMARTFFRYNKTSVNNIDLHIKDISSAAVLADELEKRLDVSASHWNSGGGYLEALEVEENVMFLILAMIVLIASFNIISSLIILVQNKKNAIAMLRTIGATRNSVMRIFFICGGSIGLIGTFIGICMGLLFVSNIEAINIFLESLFGNSVFNQFISFFNKIPAVVVVSDIVKISFMSVILSFIAAIIPSVKASQQNPAKILRAQ